MTKTYCFINKRLVYYFMDTFEIYQMLSLSFYLLIKERWWFYDKARNFSIYYNITPILSCNCFTPKIAKASDLNIR